MAHEAILDGQYLYTDEDINIILRAIRGKRGLAEGMSYLLHNPAQDGFHIVILDVVNGKEKATPQERNLETHLNKHVRPITDDYLRVFHYALTLWQGDFNKIIKPVTQHLKKDKVDSSFIPTIIERIKHKFQEYNNDAASLKKYLDAEMYRNMGRDPFDEMGYLLHTQQSVSFRMLFPLNVNACHWVLGEIEIVKQGLNVFVDLSKLDPKGGGSFKNKELVPTTEKAIVSRLKEIIAEGINVHVVKKENNAPVRQPWWENTSCGVITCRDLDLRAQGKPVGSCISNGALNLRREQYEMVQRLEEIEKATRAYECTDFNIDASHLRNNPMLFFVDIKQYKNNIWNVVQNSLRNPGPSF